MRMNDNIFAVARRMLMLPRQGRRSATAVGLDVGPLRLKVGRRTKLLMIWVRVPSAVVLHVTAVGAA